MSIKVELDVDAILTCAVPIEAEVGDSLVVMNGVVVGMIEQRRRVVAEKVVPVVKPPPAPRFGPSIEKQALTIIDTMHAKGVQLTAHEIAYHMPRQNGQTERPRIAEAMTLLRRQGTILPVTKGRFPAYRLADALQTDPDPPAQVNSSQAPH